MINEENLNKMYNGLIDNKELTTKQLKEYGFNSKDLSGLIENGVLERIKRGYYAFISIDDLFFYGEKLISLNEYDRAIACFEKCYEMDQSHLEACSYLFLRAIRSRDYNKAFDYLEKFYNSDNEYYKNDGNFYIYLLSMITEIPDKYREYARKLRIEDIKINPEDKRYKDVYFQNKVRLSSLMHKFDLASKQLDGLIKRRGGLSVQNIIVKTLLIQAISVQKRINGDVINLVIAKKYDEIVMYLEEIQRQRNLSTANFWILSLAKDISEFRRTGVVPEIQITSTSKIFDAVNGKNYELALSLNKEYIERANIEPNSNAMFMLLKDITELIQSKKKIDQETSISKPIKKDTTSLKSKSLDITAGLAGVTNKVTIATVISYLMKQDFDSSFKELRNYLNELNKVQYEFLIVDLIKISLMEKDMAFTKPMIALTYISREKFNFDISEYIKNFYETLAQNRFDESRVYLDIISKANKLGQNCVLTDCLEQVLNATEKKLNCKKNNEGLDRIDDSLKVVKEEPISQVKVQESIQSEPVYQNVDSNNAKNEACVDDSSKDSSILQLSKNDVKNSRYDDNEFIKSKLDELYDKGIVLLGPMDRDRRKSIHNIVKDIPDVVSFCIGVDPSRQIVLRFKPYMVEVMDFSEVAREAYAAYKSQDYDLCIEKLRQLLAFGTPKAWVYARLGLAYMKKFDKDTAIDYLTIATALSKEEQSDCDFTELIASLKGMVDPEDKKPRVRMTTDDFADDTKNYYGIENIHEVVDLISSGMSIDEACANLDMNEEQKSIVGLIFAREYYSQSNYRLGDQYLKRVEKTKNKSKRVKSLFEEVRRNKKFYRNRV